METKSIEKRKARLTIYVDKALHLWLWNRRAKTGKSVSEIAEDLMIRRIGRDAQETQPAKRA